MVLTAGVEKVRLVRIASEPDGCDEAMIRHSEKTQVFTEDGNLHHDVGLGLLSFQEKWNLVSEEVGRTYADLEASAESTDL